MSDLDVALDRRRQRESRRTGRVEAFTPIRAAALVAALVVVAAALFARLPERAPSEPRVAVLMLEGLT